MKKMHCFIKMMEEKVRQSIIITHIRVADSGRIDMVKRIQQ